MNSNVAIPRSVIIYGVCIPLAMLMGYLLTTPLDLISVMGVGSVMILLLVPILLRWHHMLLVFSWNAVVNAFFFPGQPRFWMLLTVPSIAFSILDRIMNKNKRLLNVPSVTKPLIVLMMVIVITAKLRGGMGLSSFGSASFGGKKYFEALLAIFGFFALSWQRIPLQKATVYSSLYFLSGISQAMGNIAYSTGIYWLFWLFPVESAVLQVQHDFGVDDRSFNRLTGVAFASIAPFCFVLVRHGIRGVLDFSEGFSFLPFNFGRKLFINQPYRPIILIGALVVSLVGGYRSMPIILGLLVVVQLFVEGLYKTRIVFALAAASILFGAALLPFTDKLPLTFQRAICFLPVKLNPVVRYDAWASTDWRVRMWNVIVEQLPHYLLLGKGYGGSATELYLARESMRRGLLSDFEGSFIAGDYHSGPFSVLMPFGVFGAGAFVWFLIAGGKVLWRNSRYGPPELKTINQFLLTYYLTQVLFYFVVYGAFASGLCMFTGTVALSISLNGGMLSPSAAPSSVPATEPKRTLGWRGSSSSGSGPREIGAPA